MKVINLSGDEQALQLKSSLMSLQSALKNRAYRGTKLYRFAVARRFSVCYVAFLQYLVSRLHIYEVAHTDLELEDLIHRCRHANLFSKGHEGMIIRMSLLYAALTYPQEGYSAHSDELIRDIPQMAKFLEQFITLHSVLPFEKPHMHVTV